MHKYFYHADEFSFHTTLYKGGATFFVLMQYTIIVDYMPKQIIGVSTSLRIDHMIREIHEMLEQLRDWMLFKKDPTLWS
jgi:hypothetical protein